MSVRVGTVKVLRLLRVNRVMAKLYYDNVHGFASAGKELPETVRRCMRRALEMGTAGQGDYYEFGIFKGHTFYHAQKSADELGLKQMRFFGFDSFQGLPAPESIDKTEEEHFYEGQYACSYDSVVAALTERGVDWRRTFLVKGYFNESLTAETRERFGMGKAPIALIDCDLYSSTVDTLRFLEPMLIDGSILIMDDWNAFDKDESRGQRRALGEFLGRLPAWRAEPWFDYGSYGQVFILRRNDSAMGSGRLEASGAN
jgi:O-methyltransferase